MILAHPLRTLEILPLDRNGNVFFFFFYFLSSTYFTERRTDPPQEAIGPKGANCFSRGSVPEFLRKPIITCSFPREGGGSGTPVPSYGSAHVYLVR